MCVCVCMRACIPNLVEKINKMFNLLPFFNFIIIISNSKNQAVAGASRGVMVKTLVCEIVVGEFVLQSHYYVHFRTNTLGKCMNPLILPAMG